MITGVGIWREVTADHRDEHGPPCPCTWNAELYTPEAHARGERGYMTLYTLDLRGLSEDEATAKIMALPEGERRQAIGLIERTAEVFGV